MGLSSFSNTDYAPAVHTTHNDMVCGVGWVVVCGVGWVVVVVVVVGNGVNGGGRGAEKKRVRTSE